MPKREIKSRKLTSPLCHEPRCFPLLNNAAMTIPITHVSFFCACSEDRKGLPVVAIRGLLGSALENARIAGIIAEDTVLAIDMLEAGK